MVVSGHMFAQQAEKQIAFRELTVAHGLSQNSVVSIAQDSTGFMWFATQDGLNKYDGRNFTHFNKQFEDVTRTTYSKLGKIYIDRNNGKWIITNSGNLEYYNDTTNAFTHIPISSNVSKIHQSQDGTFYIGTFGNGLYQITATKDTIQLLKKNDIDLEVYDFHNYKDTVLAATSKGVLKITHKDYSLEQVLHNNATNYSSLEVSSQGTLFLGSFGKGLFLKSKSDTEFKQFKGLNSQTLPDNLIIQDLLLDRNNKLWIATYGQGVFLIDFNTENIHHFLADKSNPYALHYNDVLSLYEDFTGTIWLGTDGAGLSYFDEHLAKFNILTNNQVPHNIYVDMVRAITVKDGTMWIGTSGNGLTSITTKTNQFKTITSENSALAGNRIVSLLKVEDGIWVGHQNHGLQHIDNLGKISSYIETKGFTIWKIAQEDEENFWLCTRNKGLILFNRNNGIAAVYNNENSKLTTNNIRTVEKDNLGNLWIGTEHEGLFKLNLEDKSIAPIKEIPDQIKSLYADGQWLWIGTNGNGLKGYNLQTNSAQLFTTQDGLPNNVIYGILPGEHKSLWLSSNRGITKMNLTDYSFTNYENYDGLQAYEFNTGAYFKDTNGMLYFGGLEGINWFNPKQLSYNQVKPKTIITGLEIFSKPHQFEQNEAFSANNNTITFNFSGLHFSQPDRNQYKYQLANHDNDWILSGNKNTAHYTNLDPGHYTFKVLSSNYDGIWNEVPATYSFSIKQPWYLSIYAIIGYGLFAIALGIAIYRYLKWRWHMKMQLDFEHQETERLKKLDEFKTKLYTNISHEFRTPLTLIMGPIQKQLQKQNLSHEDESELSMVQESSKRLLNLVNQMLDLSKLETGNLKLSVSRGNLTLLLKQLATAFEFKAQEKNIKFSYELVAVENVWFDKDVIEKIVSNLLGNAIKYTPENGNITFTTSHNEGNITLSVLNNGNQLKDEELPRLFQRYHQANKQSEGIGIGLSLIKELTVLSHGNIVAHTMNKDDIQFSVTLPVERSYFNNSEISELEHSKLALEEKLESEATKPNYKETSITEQPVLLLVEDDRDIRNFIKSIFKTDYKILEAQNGSEGIEKALKLIPDLIISDIMMPETNGIDLCNTLKTDYKTSHIPIVLLTAKVGDKNEITGLKTGADAYVTKPFNSEKLKVRVSKLLESRKNLQAYYGKHNVLNFHNIQTNTTEEKFLTKLQEAIKENIVQPDFSAEKLSELMQMSRMQLHRKLKAITGQTASEFINSERMKLAVSIMEKSDSTISEVAYLTGFNTPSYFIKCFKKIHHCTPSEYLLNSCK